MTKLKLCQCCVNQIFYSSSLFFFIWTGVTWYYHTIYIEFTYFASFTGYGDDIFEVISNLMCPPAHGCISLAGLDLHFRRISMIMDNHSFLSPYFLSLLPSRLSYLLPTIQLPFPHLVSSFLSPPFLPSFMFPSTAPSLPFCGYLCCSLCCSLGSFLCRSLSSSLSLPSLLLPL